MKSYLNIGVPHVKCRMDTITCAICQKSISSSDRWDCAVCFPRQTDKTYCSECYNKLEHKEIHQSRARENCEKIHGMWMTNVDQLADLMCRMAKLEAENLHLQEIYCQSMRAVHGNKLWVVVKKRKGKKRIVGVYSTREKAKRVSKKGMVVKEIHSNQCEAEDWEKLDLVL